MENPFALTGKTILVTGASSGIGRATASLCARMGADVILTGRNRERLQEACAQLPGDRHQWIAADLTAAADRQALAARVPVLDGIVHCAGTGHRKLCKNLTAEDITAVMETNFNATVLLQSELLVEKKVGKQASIVLLSSRTAEVPTVANALYSASKGALQSYAKCLALELAPRQIRVNCICPAMVWTPLIVSDGATEEQLREEEARYPLKRYGRPEDIANLAVFLLSDASSWMTGSCIDITGGSITV